VRSSDELPTKRPLSSRRLRAVGLVALLTAGLAFAAFAIEISDENDDAARRLEASRVLRGHKGGVLGLAFSPDGRTLAAAAVAGNIRLWDTSSWRLIGELPGQTTLLDLAFSPDDRTLVTAGEDGWVKLWDLQKRSLVGQFRGHRGWVIALALSDDGKTLATAGDYYYGDGRIRLWDVARLEPVGRPAYADAVAMWFSGDGRVLTFLNAAGQIKDYDLVHRRAVRPPPLFDTGYTEYGNGEVSPDRSKLVLVNEDGQLMLWDVTRRPPRDLPLRPRTYQSWGADPVAFAPDGKTFASASAFQETYTPSKTVVLWDVAHRAPRGELLRFHNRGVSSMAFSPNGQTLAVGGADGTVRLRNLASRSP
jgi:hypothetical protein